MITNQVSILSKPVKPSPTKCEGSEMFVDRVEQRLGPLQAKGDVSDIKVLHVVARLHVVVDLKNS